MLGNQLSSDLRHDGKGRRGRGGNRGCASAVVWLLRCDGPLRKISVRESIHCPGVGSPGSIPASRSDDGFPGATPNVLSHLPTPAAPSSESHTYLSQTTRPTPTAPHVTNRPRPVNDSHSALPHPRGPNGSCYC